MKIATTIACVAFVFTSPAHAAVRNYFAPQWQGEPLDACLTVDGACGKPAADAFCQSEGFESALIFQRQPGGLTRKIDSGLRCSGPTCMAFRQIKCFSTRDNIAGLAQAGD